MMARRYDCLGNGRYSIGAAEPAFVVRLLSSGNCTKLRRFRGSNRWRGRTGQFGAPTRAPPLAASCGPGATPRSLRTAFDRSEPKSARCGHPGHTADTPAHPILAASKINVVQLLGRASGQGNPAASSAYRTPSEVIQNALCLNKSASTGERLELSRPRAASGLRRISHNQQFLIQLVLCMR